MPAEAGIHETGVVVDTCFSQAEDLVQEAYLKVVKALSADPVRDPDFTRLAAGRFRPVHPACRPHIDGDDVRGTVADTKHIALAVLDTLLVLADAAPLLQGQRFYLRVGVLMAVGWPGPVRECIQCLHRCRCDKLSHPAGCEGAATQAKE
ncbi:MAG: hypothetical protein ACREXW_15400 [Gammaproteobacteria bacterium]